MADRIEEVHTETIRVVEPNKLHVDGEGDSVEIVTIRTDIEHTRHDISETLDALKEKLSPQVLLDQAKEHAKEVATEAIDHARDSVKENITHKIDEVKGTVGDAVHHAADAVGSVVHNVTETVSDAVHHVTGSVSDNVQTAKDKVTDAIGTAKDKVSSGVDKSKHTVGKTAQSAQNKIGGVMDGAKSAGSSVLDTARRNPIPTALIGLGALYLGLKHWDDSKASIAPSSTYDYTDYDPIFVDSDASEGIDDVDEIIIIETIDPLGSQSSDMTNNGSRLSAPGSGANSGNPLFDTIQNNPIPAVLTILGASWLFFKSREPKPVSRYGDYSEFGDSYSYKPSGNNKVGDVIDNVKGKAAQVGSNVSDVVGNAKDAVGGAVSNAKDAVGGAASNAKDAVGGAVSNAKDAVGGAVSTAKDKVGSAVDTTKSKVSDAVGSAQSAVGAAKTKAVQATGQARDQIGALGSSAVEQSRRAGGMVADTFNDNPMAYGLVALGIGAAVGLLLPGTEPENRLLGQKRDQLVGQAQSSAQDLAQRVQHVAEQSLDAARTTAVQEAHAQGLASE